MAQNGDINNKEYKMSVEQLKIALNKSIFGTYFDEIKDAIGKKNLLELCAGPGANIPLWVEFDFQL